MSIVEKRTEHWVIESEDLQKLSICSDTLGKPAVFFFQTSDPGDFSIHSILWYTTTCPLVVFDFYGR